MRGLGIVTALAGLAAAMLAAAVGVKSIPDIKRYLKMRAM